MNHFLRQPVKPLSHLVCDASAPISFFLGRIRLFALPFHSRSLSPTSLIASTRAQSGPQFSPDGKKIAFGSNRSGSPEIWICDSEGLNPTQLTSIGGPETGTPRWSPDGKQISFDSHAKGNWDIYLVSAEGGSPKCLTTGSADNNLPSWSRDGKAVYFTSNRSGDYQVWKMPADGGEAGQITKQGRFVAFESPDGKFVYYTKNRYSGTPGIWWVPVEGGEENLVYDSFKAQNFGNWAVVSDGIYLINPDSKVGRQLNFSTLPGGRLRRSPSLGTSGYGLSLLHPTAAGFSSLSERRAPATLCWWKTSAEG